MTTEKKGKMVKKGKRNHKKYSLSKKKHEFFYRWGIGKAMIINAENKLTCLKLRLGFVTVELNFKGERFCRMLSNNKKSTQRRLFLNDQ